MATHSLNKFAIFLRKCFSKYEIEKKQYVSNRKVNLKKKKDSQFLILFKIWNQSHHQCFQISGLKDKTNNQKTKYLHSLFSYFNDFNDYS